MVLSKQDIISRLSINELAFSPALDGFQMQPHAIDLRLGFDFHIPRTWEMTAEGRKALLLDPLDPENKGKNFEEVKLKSGQYFELLPEEYIIGTTLERIEINATDIMAVLYPRSSVNRRGLAVDLSGIIDAGYKGHLMIPIVNKTQKQVIRLYPGERICQVVFQTISTKLTVEEANLHGLTKAKYDGSKDTFTSSKSDREDETSLLKSGNIDKLKREFAVSIG